MKLLSVTIQNYRSITSAKKIALRDYTCLVGPNNEGKSNILRALACSMKVLSEFRNIPEEDDELAAYNEMIRRDRLRTRRGSYDYYNFERDFPIQLQTGRASPTSVTLDFELSNEELEEFKRSIGSKLNGTLPVKIEFGKQTQKIRKTGISIHILKQGRGSKSLNAKANKIANFIVKKLRFEYIPAIRTSSSARSALDQLVSQGIRNIERSDEYRSAVNTVYNLQKEYLDELSRNVLPTLQSFMPTMNNFLLRGDRASRFRSVREHFDIRVDDGVETDIEFKGDGVQSLVALALMRHVADARSGEEATIVAIEEPESHLHPEAIRDLSTVVRQLSERAQVLVSTHSPILVKWEPNASCVLVEKNKAKQARNATEVRKSLGIILSDNMSSAEYVLFVEGQTDVKLVEHLVRTLGGRPLRTKMSSGMFKIAPLGGASHLNAMLYRSSTEVLGVHVFLDNDRAGKDAAEKAVDAQLLNKSAITHCICQGMRESELEDLVNVGFYEHVLRDKYGVINGISKLRSSDKFSDRLRSCFEASGKLFDQSVLDKFKGELVELVCHSETNDWLISEKAGAVRNLLCEIETKFGAQPASASLTRP